MYVSQERQRNRREMWRQEQTFCQMPTVCKTDVPCFQKQIWTQIQLSVYKNRMSLLLLVTGIFASLRFLGLGDRGTRTENLKSPITSTSTPSDAYGPIRWVLYSVMKISLPLLAGSFSYNPSKSCFSVLMAPWAQGRGRTLLSPGNGDRNLLEGKRSKSSFQAIATTVPSPHHLTPILFHLIFSTTLKHVFLILIFKVKYIFQVGEPVYSLWSWAYFSLNLCLHNTPQPPSPGKTTTRIAMTPEHPQQGSTCSETSSDCVNTRSRQPEARGLGGSGWWNPSLGHKVLCAAQKWERVTMQHALLKGLGK